MVSFCQREVGQVICHLSELVLVYTSAVLIILKGFRTWDLMTGESLFLTWLLWVLWISVGSQCIPGATALPMNRGGEGGKCPCDFSVIRDQNKKRRSAAEVHLFCMPRGVKLLLREQNLGIRNTSKKSLGC